MENYRPAPDPSRGKSPNLLHKRGERWAFENFQENSISGLVTLGGQIEGVGQKNLERKHSNKDLDLNLPTANKVSCCYRRKLNQQTKKLSVSDSASFPSHYWSGQRSLLRGKGQIFSSPLKHTKCFVNILKACWDSTDHQVHANSRTAVITANSWKCFN